MCNSMHIMRPALVGGTPFRTGKQAAQHAFTRHGACPGERLVRVNWLPESLFWNAVIS
jgi:hypothetical protein